MSNSPLTESEMAHNTLEWAQRFITNGENSVKKAEREIIELQTEIRVAKAVEQERQKWTDDYGGGFSPRTQSQILEERTDAAQLELKKAQTNLSNSRQYIEFLRKVLAPFL